jgi:hypothetical protein
MKRLAIFLLILFSSFTANSQFAIVRDKDGYVNVRQEQNINSKIIGKIRSDVIIEAASPNDDDNDVWFATMITIPKNELDTLKNDIICGKPDTDSVWIYGYVHKSRLQFICDIPEIKGRYQRTKNALIFENGSINLRILLKNFEPTAHKISRNSGGYVELIDGLEPFGVDGGVPKKEIISIQLTINGQSVKIPRGLYRNLYEMTLENVRLRRYNNDIYFDMPMNSDGAGSWGAVWVIRDGRIIKKICERLC